MKGMNIYGDFDFEEEPQESYNLGYKRKKSYRALDYSYEERKKRYVVLDNNEKLMLYFAWKSRDQKKLKTKQNFWVWYNMFQKDKRKQIGYNTMCKIISRMKAKEELEKY